MEPNQDAPQEPVQQDLITDYHADIHQIELEGYELRVKKARNALFWAAGLILLGQVFVYVSSHVEEIDPISVSVALAIVGTFIGLAIWTKKKPYSAIITGLIVFILYILLVVVTNGIVYGAEGVFKSLIGWFLIKIFIFVALIRPLKDAKELQKIKEEQAR